MAWKDSRPPGGGRGGGGGVAVKHSGDVPSDVDVVSKLRVHVCEHVRVVAPQGPVPCGGGVGWKGVGEAVPLEVVRRDHLRYHVC